MCQREIRILRSNAGYYVGTLIDGLPNCRISDYYPSEYDAFLAILDENFQPSYCAEICQEVPCFSHGNAPNLQDK